MMVTSRSNTNKQHERNLVATQRPKELLQGESPVTSFHTRSLWHSGLSFQGLVDQDEILMVEPLAAVVLNSLLPSCSTLRYSLALNPVARAMKYSSGMSLTPDFFTPKPRRVKGKKAKDNLTLPCHLSQSQEWSSCAKRHLLWCPRTLLMAVVYSFILLFSYQIKPALL
jgi:hypothetical protein